MNIWKLSLNNSFRTISRVWINLFVIKKAISLMNEKTEFLIELMPFLKDEKLVLLLEKLVLMLKLLKK
jgi:hypothetical protein